ncbi:MAG: hypothetical protein IJ807_00705 [Eubacterium sp.]|nr:hypothetical protein [Eubacterium sp.]
MISMCILFFVTGILSQRDIPTKAVITPVHPRPTFSFYEDVGSLKPGVILSVNGKEEIITDLQKAWDKAAGKSGATITLRSDETVSSTLVATKDYRDVTIDLNGCVLKRSAGDTCRADGGVIKVSTNAKITITDSDPDNYPNDRKTSDDNNKNFKLGAGGIITGGRNSSSGGGIRIEENGYLQIDGGTICDNLSAVEGGGISCAGKLYMNGGAIKYNSSSIANGDTHNGGGLVIEGDGMADISGTTFEGNDSPCGGAIEIGNSGSLTIDECIFKDNIADYSGGAIYINGAESIVIVRNAEFTVNYAANGYGGAVWVRGEKVFFDSCDIHDNIAWLDGGGVYAAVTDDAGRGEGSSVNLQGKCIIDNNTSEKKKKVSNLSVDAQGNTRSKQAIIHVGWLDSGSKIGINRDKAKVNACLVNGLREIDTKYFYADSGELEFKKKGERTEVFMATALTPMDKSVFFIAILILVGISAVVIQAYKRRKKGDASL